MWLKRCLMPTAKCPRRIRAANSEHGPSRYLEGPSRCHPESDKENALGLSGAD